MGVKSIDASSPSTFARVPFVAAIRGPVVMIVLGVLFLLDYSAGIRIGKTWPVLLIVAGLLHLMGRVRVTHVPAGLTGDRSAGAPQP